MKITSPTLQEGKGDRQVAPMLLRPSEVASILAISPRKLWSLTASGEIPCVKIDRAVRYDREDLRAWIDRRKGGQK